MPDDHQMQSAVQAALEQAPGVTAAHIGVAAHAGVVTLTGRVANLAIKIAAETAARQVEGVLALAEEIEVRSRTGSHRSDEDIAQAAVNRIAADTSILPGTVQIEVEDGWVTVTGQVDWSYQKLAVEQDMRGLPGAFGVSNDLTVQPARTEADVRSEIVRAVRQSGIKDPGAVTVAVTGGHVRLSGTVYSLQDRNEAAVGPTPDAARVENEIAATRAE